MGFTSSENGGGLPDITAVISNIGVDYREYDNGNDESRLVIIWEPEDENFSTQTEILSTYNVLDVEPDKSVIRVGSEENGFDLELIGSVIKNGVLGYKAAVWMKQLEDLGVKVPSETGNLGELIGLKAVLRQMTYNEVKGRSRKENEKPFWVPIKVMATAQMPADDKEKVEEVCSVSPPISLAKALLAVAPGKVEAEMLKWFQMSVYIGEDKSVVPLFAALDAAIKDGRLKIENGAYVRIERRSTGEGVLKG